MGKSPDPDQDLQVLAEALAELRDALTQVGLALRDHLTETDSPERVAALAQVQQQLARIVHPEPPA